MTGGFQRDRSTRTSRHRQVASRGERGSNLIEQGFIIVFLLTMLFGIVDFGRALYTYHFVSSAAREASRWASVRSSTCVRGALTGCPALPSNVQSTFTANLSNMGLDPSKATFNTTYVTQPGVGAASCTAPANQVGCVVSVQVVYDYRFFFPFLPTSTVTMTSQSQMVITQ